MVMVFTVTSPFQENETEVKVTGKQGQVHKVSATWSREDLSRIDHVSVGLDLYFISSSHLAERP